MKNTKANLEKQAAALGRLITELDKARFGAHDIAIDGYLIDAKEDLEAAIERIQRAARLTK